MPSAVQPHRATENRILAAANRTHPQHFFSQLERVSLQQGEVLYEPDAQIQYAYFPETAVCSMLATMEDGSMVEVGPVGDEGLVGLRIFLGAQTSTNQVLVHIAGTALRLKADVLRAELSLSQSLLPRLLLRYTQMLLAMTGQSGACYKLHKLERQFARWLLSMCDYVGEEMQLTHELIALTLGCRRASVTELALELKNAGIIDYYRGHMRIIKTEELKALACECYQAIKVEYDRLYAELPEIES